MNEPRDVLHQPPNPDDLRRVPPTSPDCARVRGWLRDFVDGDLEAGYRSELEDHVHRCRVCAIELARSEHELLQVRTALARGSRRLPPLPPDFAARTVERLVLDETSLLSAETLRAAAAMAPPAPRTEGAARAEGGRAVRFSPAVLLVGALLLLSVLGFGLQVADGLSGVPQQARLVVVEGQGASARNRELGAGQGLGENQLLRVARGGGALVEWHDLAARAQPAAMLQLHGQSSVRLVDGAPELSGRIDVQTNRPVEIPMADGSTLELGVGEYTISVEAAQEMAGGRLVGGDDPLAHLPKELLIEIEVHRGEPAGVLRPSLGQTLVEPGYIGVYQGKSSTTVVPSGGGPVSADLADAADEPARVPQVPDSQLLGRVQDAAGMPVPGADVLLTGGSFGASVPLVSGGDGAFAVGMPGALDLPYSLVVAMPPAWRRDLGVLAPDVHPIVRQGHLRSFVRPFTFAPSAPFHGLVRDDAGVPRQGVQVVPCIVDELFGTVLPMPGERRLTEVDGTFVLERLPASLPPHQSLRLVLSHDDLAAAAVAIPVRGVDLAQVPFPPITLRRLQWVRLLSLPANLQVEVLEELTGLPPGTGLSRRVVTTNNQGVVPMMRVGWSSMWVRYGGATTSVVRQLVIDEFAGLPRYRPDHDTVTSMSAVFQDLEAIPGSNLAVADTYRHQRLVGARPGGDLAVVSLRGPDGQALSGAQVFQVEADGPRGCGLPTFLGFTAADGRIGLPAAADSDIVVIGNGGEALLASRAVFNAGIYLTAAATGRAVLAPSLRPAEAGAVVTLHFEPLDWPLSSPAPVLVRHAAAATGWEAPDLLPGPYLLLLDGVAREVVVPSGGFVVVQP